MEKKTVLAGGLVVLLLIGVVSVFAVSDESDDENKDKHFWGLNKHDKFSKGFRSDSGYGDKSPLGGLGFP